MVESTEEVSKEIHKISGGNPGLNAALFILYTESSLAFRKFADEFDGNADDLWSIFDQYEKADEMVMAILGEGQG